MGVNQSVPAGLEEQVCLGTFDARAQGVPEEGSVTGTRCLPAAAVKGTVPSCGGRLDWADVPLQELAARLARLLDTLCIHRVYNLPA